MGRFSVLSVVGLLLLTLARTASAEPRRICADQVSVFIRSDPAESGRAVGTMIPDQSFEMLGLSEDEAWVRVELEGQEVGWVPRSAVCVPENYSWPWQRPVENACRTSRFGYRTHPILGTRRLHGGVDIGVPQGTDVHPVAPGEVIAAGRMGGLGYAIKIRHDDGRESAYGHLCCGTRNRYRASSIRVRVGDRVDYDTVLAQVGTTGMSTGPHLHLEARVNGDRVNPEGEDFIGPLRSCYGGVGGDIAEEDLVGHTDIYAELEAYAAGEVTDLIGTINQDPSQAAFGHCSLQSHD